MSQETQRESLAKVDRAKWRAKIMGVLWRAMEPMTASEISHELGYGYNRQTTQPRLSEMKRDGVVYKICEKYDPRTDRNVTAYWLAKRKAPDEAGPLDKGECKNTPTTEYHEKGGMSNE